MVAKWKDVLDELDDQPLHVVITGGRDYDNRARLHGVLDGLPVVLLTEGGARGADRLAGEWADAHQVEHVVCKADWDKHGRAAGIIRNGTMLEEARARATADNARLLVIAFPGGRGTQNTVDRVKKLDWAMWEIDR